jgi:hypothetical protein
MDTAVLTHVLSALAQGAGGQAGQQAWTALAALTGRLPGRQAAGTEAVEAARANTGDPAAAGHLAGKAAADPGLAAALGDWLAGTQALLTAGHTTLNQVHGAVSGTVIQAGDVFGGIRLGGPPGPAA